MKPIKIKYPQQLLVLTRGTGGRTGWYPYDSFLRYIQDTLEATANCGSERFLLYPATGKDVYLTIDEQKQLARDRKKGAMASINQFNQIATLLGIEWLPIYPAYIQHKYAIKSSGKSPWEIKGWYASDFEKMYNKQATKEATIHCAEVSSNGE